MGTGIRRAGLFWGGALCLIAVLSACASQAQSVEPQDVEVVSDDEMVAAPSADTSSGSSDGAAPDETDMDDAPGSGGIGTSSVPGLGLPDGSANISEIAQQFVSLEQQDLDWVEIDTGFGTITDSFVQAGVFIANTSDFDWIASVDGTNWELLIDWDRPSRLAVTETAWYLLTDDAGAAEVELQLGEKRSAGVEVFMSTDEGVSWEEVAIDVDVVEVPNATAAIIGERIVAIDDVVLVSVRAEYLVDWEATAVAQGLAKTGDVVIPLQDGEFSALRVIGPAGDETISIRPDVVGIDQDTLEQILHMAPPVLHLWRSTGGESFEDLGPTDFGLLSLDIFDGQFALTGFIPAQFSSDGGVWSSGPAGEVELSWADAGWWIGNVVNEGGGAFEVVLQQSLDGGSTWESVSGPEENLIAQLSWVSSAGASTTWTEDAFGLAGNDDSAIEVVRDGYLFSMLNDSELTVIDPDGEVLVDSLFLWGGPPDPHIAVDLFGLIWLIDVDENAIITSVEESEFYGESSGSSAGRSWAGWSNDGAEWFYDEIAFGDDAWTIQVNGGSLLALGSPFSRSDTVRVAQAAR